MTTHDGRAGIDAGLVRRLVATQFPQWAGLEVRPVAVEGWDNRTYRLGEVMSVRLPTAAGYVPGIAKEDRWLPTLAPRLSVDVPCVLGTGVPGGGYPFPWSVRAWIPGETARLERITDLGRFAAEVADFLRELRACDISGAPAAGEHSAFRGVSPGHYDADARRCLARLDSVVDTAAAAEVWAAALASEWQGLPVWFHGDVAMGNLLVRGGGLAAVIDFGTCGVGDPACDLVLAWTLLPDDVRAVFREAVGLDDDTWARARGWALWKALLGLEAAAADAAPVPAEAERRVVDALVADHRR